MVIGSGGREHTLLWKIKNDNSETKLFAVPGNGGTHDIAECIPAKTVQPEYIADMAIKNNISLTVVGPEVPLAEGISDVFQQKELKIFGPIRKAAKLEASKSFAKEFMKQNKIPTANFEIADSYDGGIQILERRVFPCVIKYDGLAAGKGVLVANDFDEAIDFLEKIYRDKIFGDKNNKIIIEDCLEGREMSYLIFTDTVDFIPMVPAKDYKRVFDNDEGPNTGGMGCYSPPSLFNQELEELIQKNVVVPTIKGLQKENIDYRGVLYFGLMLTQKGPYVLEYNVRFGDPETQVILPRMESNLVEIMEAVTEQSLKQCSIRWSNKKSLCVILASAGYPGKYEVGKEIKGLEKIKDLDVIIFHAGTTRENGKTLTAGGRVLAVTATANTFTEARDKVYKAIDIIDFEGKHYRKDIGLE
ncbi:MAG: phosphoribosylamine--glycine ligase [Candidatus Omnitrophica bacterium]|nr:phosphoribosylamine--glycine ligase [Candidatus Omnitrophota bacterium]MCM8777356.1 phosphoribosylamine--glycine ligase [Candidatus Omnitrophota bacterium]